LKHIYHYFAPPTGKSGKDSDPGLGKFEVSSLSQSLDDFIPILGNDGKKFLIITIRAFKLIFNANRTG
jgi:hypothetical protein